MHEISLDVFTVHLFASFSSTDSNLSSMLAICLNTLSCSSLSCSSLSFLGSEEIRSWRCSSSSCITRVDGAGCRFRFLVAGFVQLTSNPASQLGPAVPVSGGDCRQEFPASGGDAHGGGQHAIPGRGDGHPSLDWLSCKGSPLAIPSRICKTQEMRIVFHSVNCTSVCAHI